MGSLGGAWENPGVPGHSWGFPGDPLGGPGGSLGVPGMPLGGPSGSLEGPWPSLELPRDPPGLPRDPLGTLLGCFGGRHGRFEEHCKTIVFIAFPALWGPGRSLGGFLVVTWGRLGCPWASLGRPWADRRRPWSVPGGSRSSWDVPVGSLGCPWGLSGGYDHHWPALGSYDAGRFWPLIVYYVY